MQQSDHLLTERMSDEVLDATGSYEFSFFTQEAYGHWGWTSVRKQCFRGYMEEFDEYYIRFFNSLQGNVYPALSVTGQVRHFRFQAP
jgi:hypothetical protein